MTNPLLKGVRILDLSRLLPGPFCTQYLAQLGADVVKVEDPVGGDYARLLSPELFDLINRGKRSVALDLRDPDDAETFCRLADQADVVIETFRPGVMDRLGCGAAVLRQRNPRLVHASLTGYGQTGPYRDRAGHDINYCAYAGVLDQSGPADGPPAIPGVQIADLAGGALTAAVAILAAVLGARASGEGTKIDLGMLDGTLALQAIAAATVRTMGHSLPRGQDVLTGGLPSYGVYACADGRHVALGALEPKFFANFCAAVDRPDLAALPVAPGRAGEPLRAALTALFLEKTRDAWDAALGDADCCLTGVYSPEEALANPQVRARGLWSGEAGKPAFGFPARFSNAAVTDGVAPGLGADTEAVLRVWDPGRTDDASGL